MLLIEGSDQTGKTTLAQKLVARAAEHPHHHGFATYYSHMTRPPADWDYTTDYVLRAQPFAIQDRFHLGGIVYGDIIRGGTKITPESLRWIEAHMALQGSFVVVLRATDDVMVKRLAAQPADRKEMYNPEYILKANIGFSTLIEGTHASLQPHIDMVFTAEAVDEYPTDKDVDAILEAWFHRLRVVRDMNNHPHMIGFRG
jgi:hypothetical protein